MSAFSPLSLDDLFALELPPVDYVVDGMIPLGAATLFSAREKAGKGLFTLDLCACVAFEEPFLDRAVKSGAAIYCAAEENIRDVRARIEARIGSRRDGPLHVLRLDGSTEDRLDLSDAEGVQKFYNMAAEVRPVLVVLDVLREVHNGREDSSDDMAPLLRPLRQIAHELNIALVVNHHMNRGGTFRGSTAIAAAFDVVMEMTPDDVDIGDALTATLKVNGRYGRQHVRIKLGDGMRWGLAGAVVTIAEDTARDRILAFLAGADEGHDCAGIAAELSTPALPVAVKTIQNAVGLMMKESPLPIVATGRGVRGDPRRYRLPQPGLFPPEGDPLGAREGGNSRPPMTGTPPDRAGSNGNQAWDESDVAWEDVPV